MPDETLRNCHEPFDKHFETTWFSYKTQKNETGSQLSMFFINHMLHIQFLFLQHRTFIGINPSFDFSTSTKSKFALMARSIHCSMQQVMLIVYSHRRKNTKHCDSHSLNVSNRVTWLLPLSETIEEYPNSIVHLLFAKYGNKRDGLYCNLHDTNHNTLQACLNRYCPHSGQLKLAFAKKMEVGNLLQNHFQRLPP